MRCRVPVLLCALLVVLLAVGATPAVAASDVEETHMEIQLEEDGDATWTVVGAVPLENDSDVESFESFAADFESGRGDVELGESAFRRAADEASTETGREMRVHSVVRRSAVVEETDDDGEVTRRGELRVSFTWTNFARVDEDGTMRVDDAFNTTEGTWLPGLEDGQSLTVRPPPGYSAPDAPIGPSEGAYHWEGPETFEPGYLEFVFEPGLNPFAGVGVSTLLLGGAVVVSGVALALGGYLLWRRGGVGDDVPWPATGNPSTEGGTADDAANGPAAEATATGDGSGAVGAATAASDDAAGSDAEPDFELLSDEERVEYLLEQNGGRMKQARIVDETGWSNAKVSQLLSAMAEDERVDKLRIGRENLISLPGEGFTDLDDEPSE